MLPSPAVRSVLTTELSPLSPQPLLLEAALASRLRSAPFSFLSDFAFLIFTSPPPSSPSVPRQAFQSPFICLCFALLITPHHCQGPCAVFSCRFGGTQGSLFLRAFVESAADLEIATAIPSIHSCSPRQPEPQSVRGGSLVSLLAKEERTTRAL